MLKTWLVVADRSRGRIFSLPSARGALSELEDLVHPESRAHERDLRTDRPGRRFGGYGALGKSNTAHDQEALEFARELATRLDAGRTGGEFERLILVAPPDFLGLLRKALNAQTAKLVDREITKNFAQLKADEIRQHLPDFL